MHAWKRAGHNATVQYRCARNRGCGCKSRQCRYLALTEGYLFGAAQGIPSLKCQAAPVRARNRRDAKLPLSKGPGFNSSGSTNTAADGGLGVCGCKKAIQRGSCQMPGTRCALKTRKHRPFGPWPTGVCVELRTSQAAHSKPSTVPFKGICGQMLARSAWCALQALNKAGQLTSRLRPRLLRARSAHGAGPQHRRGAQASRPGPEAGQQAASATGKGASAGPAIGAVLL